MGVVVGSGHIEVLQVRPLVFAVFVVLGSCIGWLVVAPEDAATRLILALMGSAAGAAVGGALVRIGKRQKRRLDFDRLIPGDGTSPEELSANFWRDKGHPPFMKPPDHDR